MSVAFGLLKEQVLVEWILAEFECKIESSAT